MKKFRNVFAQIKLLWRGWWGRKSPPPRPVQPELPAATKRAGMSEAACRHHHSRGNRDVRGKF